MLEYGGGGSTLFFGPRVKQLYTVESVKQFVERINGELQEKGIDNVQVAHAAPDGYYKDSGEVITGLHGHKRVREMAKCDVVPESSLERVLEDARRTPGDQASEPAAVSCETRLQKVQG